jgi:hypothetical protein
MVGPAPVLRKSKVLTNRPFSLLRADGLPRTVADLAIAVAAPVALTFAAGRTPRNGD